jgi:hypothetical protein
MLLLLSSISLQASNLNHETIKLHAKVFPKLILADKQLESKLMDKHIIVTVLYDEFDENQALLFQQTVKNLYSKLEDTPYLIEIRQYKDFEKNLSANAYYLLPTDIQRIQNVTHTLAKYNRISFCYDNSYLNYGALIGLSVEKTISIEMSLESLKKSKIEFYNDFLKVVKFK